MALSATAQLPRMLALCRADGSVVLPLSRQATGTGSNGGGTDVDAVRYSGRSRVLMGQLPFAPVSRVGVCDRWAAVG